MPENLTPATSKIRLYIAIILSAWLFAGNTYAANSTGAAELFSEAQAGAESSATAASPDTTQQLVQKINNLAAQVTLENRFINKLDETFQMSYPLGITKTIGGLNYTIVIEGDEITSAGAFFNAYMSFELPDKEKKLTFAAFKIPLSAEGGINGVVEMGMVEDISMELGNNATLKLFGVGNKHTGTKVHFDCGGFVDMVIDAGIEFSKSLFICEDPATGEQKPNVPLTANFTTTIQSWSDLIVNVNLPPFQLTSLKGFGFEVTNAVFDFSDLNNAAGMVFPEDYEGIDLFGDQPALWQGFYFRQVALRLPKELNNGTRITLLAQNLIIDDLGFTGQFAMENLLTLDKGSVGSWAFSIDRLELGLVANSVKSGGLAGKISLPIMKDGKTINYAAIIDQKGDFLFSASMPDNIEVPMFAAQMTIDKSSTLSIQEVNDKFAVMASLNGQINLNASLNSNDTTKTDYDNQKKGLSIGGLRFESMVISTAAPNFKPGIWSVNEIGYKTDGLNGFAIALSNIEARETPGGDVGLRFTGRVNFSGNKYCAASTLTIWATPNENNGRTRYKYKGIEVHDIYLKVDDEAISIEGYFAIFRKDIKYGNGFAAKVSARFLSIGLSATAMFGEVNDYKYFYVDAFADLTKIPVTCGSLAFYGFGGGAYFHMRQIPLTDNPLAQDPEKAKEKPIINYEPDKSTFFGFKATVALGTAGNPTPFHAIATFEITFNENMGIKTVAFYGEGFFMTKMDLLHPNTDAPVYASTYIGYDVDNRTFHGNFKVYVNAAGGMLRGINPGNLAGEVVIHVDPQDWYIHIGRPATRVGLELNVLGISIKSGSYFMMGTKIDEMPPPPEKVLRLLKLDPPNRPEGNNMSLRGFCFGTEFSISTGDLQLLMFYARFELGIGFDIILADRSDYVCANTGKKPGINGWYAEGQMYSYIEGAIGISISVFGKSFKESILEIGAATLLEAKLPNPYWMRGAVGGYYSVLGGRVKGNCNFKFELGSLCEFVKIETKETSPVQSLAVISEMTPSDGRESIDVFTAPQVVFNYEINKEFKISDQLESKDYYRIILENFDIKTDKNEAIVGEYVWNKDGNVLVFKPHNILPGKTKINLTARVYFEKKTNEGWQIIKVNNEIVTEKKSYSFTTGVAPDYIPDNNVTYSYPLKDMMNLYKNESSTGYIQLNVGQEYLFVNDPEWPQYVKFTPVAGGEPIYVRYSYESGKKKVSHIIPEALKNNTIYKFDLVRKPLAEAVEIDKNIVKNTTTSNSAAGDISVTETKAEGTLSISKEKILYTCYFRTSHYNTFAEKLGAVNIRFSNMTTLNNSVVLLSGYCSLFEVFDTYEFNENNTGLVEMIADQNGPWLAQYQIPLIYKNYPLTPNAIITYRDFNDLGFIPTKATNLTYRDYQARLLSEDEKLSGFAKSPNNTVTYFNYNLSKYTFQDFNEQKSKLLNGTTLNPAISSFITAFYPGIMSRFDYPVIAQYKLPDGKVGTKGIINIKVLGIL